MVVAGSDVGDVGREVVRRGDEAPVGGAFLGAILPRFFAARAVDFPVATTASQNERSGSPSMRRAVSRATISDSVEEWETTICFLQMAFKGKNVLGPTNAAKIPVVDLELCTQSAKEASVKSMMESLSAESPIQPCRQ